MESKKSQQSNLKRATKTCQLCGKAETNHWVSHWKVWHRVDLKNERVVLNTGRKPLKPWCSNWKDVINGANPENILPEYQKFYKHTGKINKDFSVLDSTKD